MKQTKIHVFGILILVLIPLFSSAQTKYRPGYYVNDENDTVRGLIEYRSNWKMTDYVRFKKGPDYPPTQLSPKYTTAVVVEDKVFFECFPFGQSDSEGDHEGYGYFRKLISGRLSLYLYGYDRFFVKKEGEPIREVTKNKRRFWSDDVRTGFIGFGVLKLATSDCSSYSEQELEKDYKKTIDFTDIVTKYNNCFPSGGKQVVHDIIRPGSHWAVGVHGSLVGIQHSFSSNSAFAGADMGRNITGTAGVFFSIFHPNIGDDFRVVVEPGIGKYSGYSFFKGDLTGNDVYLKYTFLRSPVLVRYTRNNMFFDLGWTNFVVMKQNNTWRYESQDNNASPVLTTNREYTLKNNFAGIAAGIGGRAQVAGRSIYTSVRFSNLFLSASNEYSQPSQMWFDLNLAIQITK